MQTTARNDQATPAGAPALVRRLGFAALGLLLAGAAYLIAVRGEAIIVDLSTLAGRIWCF